MEPAVAADNASNFCSCWPARNMRLPSSMTSVKRDRMAFCTVTSHSSASKRRKRTHSTIPRPSTGMVFTNRPWSSGVLPGYFFSHFSLDMARYLSSTRMFDSLRISTDCALMVLNISSNFILVPPRRRMLGMIWPVAIKRTRCRKQAMNSPVSS